MENTKQNKAIIALGALAYLIKVHIEDPDLRSRLLSRGKEIAEYFDDILKKPLTEDYTEEFQADVADQAKRDYEDLHGKEGV